MKVKKKDLISLNLFLIIFTVELQIYWDASLTNEINYIEKILIFI